MANRDSLSDGIHQLTPSHTVTPMGFRGICLNWSSALSLLVLLGLATELLSLAVLSYLHRDRHAERDQSFYRDKPWAAEYWNEFASASVTQYESYVVWRQPAFHGKHINIDSSGLRRTVNPSCSASARQIWMFGSSTLWGTGARDEETIPSLLSQQLSRTDRAVCVTNFGQSGWASTQEMIELELALKRLPPPDLVAFYDGMSDNFVPYQSGRVDVHMNFEHVRDLVEGGRQASTGVAYLKKTNTYQLITFIAEEIARLKSMEGPMSQGPARDLDKLAQMTATNYFENMKLVQSLSDSYGFSYVSFWEPLVFLGHKSLGPQEREVRDSVDAESPGLAVLCRKTYDLVLAAPDSHIIDLEGTLDRTREDVYLDAAHTSPEGNRLIVDAMVGGFRKSDLASRLH